MFDNNPLLIILALVILLFLFLWILNSLRAPTVTKISNFTNSTSSYNVTTAEKNNIETLTDNWIKKVTMDNDPNGIADLFCSDGNLVGTVSQIIRTKTDIRKYFEYFAKLPGIKVISRKYHVSKISGNVYLNTAFITWYWNGLEQPIVARMTFIYRDNCIYQLHSSVLPEQNTNLVRRQQ